ncbi:MAG TPA: hypothetical protein VIJ38_07155 [Acidobacteriaceae bacterium]
MDRVRFGRALGYGARHAAKSLMQAADAASSPNQAASNQAASGKSRPASRPATTQASPVVERLIETRRTVAQTQQHAGRLGRSVWSPVARFSSVLWLQVTGTFFTLLALFLSQGLWKQRGAVRLPLDSHAAGMFYLQLAAFVVFAYFAISNFVRAFLRDRH